MLYRLMNIRVLGRMDNCPYTHSEHHGVQKPYIVRDNDTSHPDKDPGLKKRERTNYSKGKSKASKCVIQSYSISLECETFNLGTS